MSDAAAALRGSEVDVEQRTQEWKTESRRQLRETFGTQGWDIEDLARRVGGSSRNIRECKRCSGPMGCCGSPTST